MTWLVREKNSLLLNLRLQPRASKDEIVGLRGDRLKVRITAPPVDGKANQRLIAFFARFFDVRKQDITLVSGETGRNKRIRINNCRSLPSTIKLLIDRNI